jgi:hypothetical protein
MVEDLSFVISRLPGMDHCWSPVLHGWVEANTAVPVIVRPTHWRKWNGATTPVFLAALRALLVQFVKVEFPKLQLHMAHLRRQWRQSGFRSPMEMV